MNLFKAITIAPVIALATAWGSVSSAQASTYDNIDLLALQLERQVSYLHREAHLHFRLTPQYVDLDKDFRQMKRHAQHLHAVASVHGSVHHLRHDVEQLGRLYHHVDRLVLVMSQTCQLDWTTIVHFRRSLRQVSITLHHLRNDLRLLDSHHGAFHDPFGHGGHHGHSFGFHFGSRRAGFSITIR